MVGPRVNPVGYNDTAARSAGRRANGADLGQQNRNVIDSQYTRTATERTIDDALAVTESQAFGNALMVGTVGYGAVAGGMSTVAAGGTFTAGAIAGGGLAAASIGVGMAGGALGFAVGNALGDAIMPLIPGFSRLPEDGEMPACFEDPIAHPSPWATLGAIALGAVAAVAIVATCGVGLVALAAAGAVAGLGMGFASAAGQYGTDYGKIALGSKDVFFQNRPVARFMDPVVCSLHSGPQAIAEGCETVFANNRAIARIGHKTTCNGTINAGCKSIAIDMDTHPDVLDIDGGWLERGTRMGVFLLDLLPIPRNPRGGRSRDRHQNLSNKIDGLLDRFCRKCGDPIDVASGQLLDTRTDIYIPGTIPLEFTRTYRKGAFGLIGRDWAGTWARNLRLDGETALYQDEEGRIVTFHTPFDEIDSGHTRVPHLELMGRKDGEIFLYDRAEQIFHVFDHRIEGRILLSAIEDRNGNRIAFQYDGADLVRVSHSDGFILDVISHEGLIREASLRDHEQGDCTFAWDYTGAGRLKEARSSQMGTLYYSYDAKGRVSRWADTNATEVFYEYDATDRIVRSWSTSGHMAVRLIHDPENGRTEVFNSNGDRSLFHYDADGLVWKEVDEAGEVWLTEWDARFNVVKRVNPLGAEVSYAYSDLGFVTSVTDADGATQSWGYDDNGLLTEQTDASGATQSFLYDGDGNLAAVTDPLGGVTSLRRGEKGEVLRIDMPGSRQERIYYDALMRPRMRTSADGHEERMRYDLEGRLTLVEDAAGSVTRYDLARGPDNPRGAVREITLPDGSTQRMSWDGEGQLASLTDGEGQTRRFSFGAFDLPLSVTDAAGHSLRLEHDSEMRLTAVVNAAGERYEYRYDAVGALVSERDFSGLVTRYLRDAASRVVAKFAPDGTETRYSYSPRGDLIEMQVGHPDGPLITRFEYDARGLMTLAENAEARVEYDYDALGRMVAERVDGREIVSSYADSASRRTERSGDVLPLVTGYSKAGLPEELRIAGHAPLTFQRDARGAEVLRQSAEGFALAQGYTPAGRLKTQMAGPIEALPDEARRGMLSISTRYDALGGSASRTHRSYDWDRAGRAIRLADKHWGETRYAYDARGQVNLAQRLDRHGVETGRTGFDYDPCRNITAIRDPQGFTPVAQAAGGRVRQRGRVSYVHDACGRVIQKRVDEPGFRPKIWQMEWNGEDRLVRLETPDGSVWRYGYDALGRRVRRLKLLAGRRDEPDAPGYLPPGAGRAYQWDGDQIVADAPVYADGTIAWDEAEAWIYEPGSFIPVAKVSGDDLWYVTTDHLGTPRELFSEDGQRVMWRADPGLWGRVEPDVPVANDDRPPASCAIRFQGQWEDEESGLHYNRFRYYDPEATQYLSPDPIGLAGGVRPQGYVADPNGWVDPLGLAGCKGASNPRAGRVDTLGRSAEKKRGPKTDQNAPHNRKIREIGDDIRADPTKRLIAGGGRGGQEIVTPTPGGHKPNRRADVLYEDIPTGEVRGINVGKAKLGRGKSRVGRGDPIKREAEAIEDLEGAGIPMEFVPYNL